MHPTYCSPCTQTTLLVAGYGLLATSALTGIWSTGRSEQAKNITMIDMHDVGRHLTVAEMSARGGNPEAVNRVGILSENLEALGKEAKTQRAMGRAGLVATIAQFGAGLFLLSDAENK